MEETFHEAAHSCKEAGGRLFEPKNEDNLELVINAHPEEEGQYWIGITSFYHGDN